VEVTIAMKKKEPRYTMEQIGKAWDKHLGDQKIFSLKWADSCLAKEFADSLKRQAAAEKRKAKPRRRSEGKVVP
jgi:hypothetical protein